MFVLSLSSLAKDDDEILLFNIGIDYLKGLCYIGVIDIDCY